MSTPHETAVGHDTMDNEHELLVDTLHALQSALAEGTDPSDLLARFDDLANAHFMEEQALMRLHAYPGYAAHQQEHDDLMAELRVVREDLAEGHLADVADTARRLEEWLLTHMHTTDEVLAEYLRQHGIRSGA